LKLTTSSSRELNLIRALLHGDSGVGKTTSFNTLPEEYTLIAGAERGLLPLRQKNFAVAQIENWKDVRELHNKLRDPAAFLEELKASKAAGALKEIRTLAFDSLSEANEMAKAQIVEVDRKALMAERNKDKLGIYDDLMNQEDWGLLERRMTTMVGAFCHLPVHVIFTSLSAWVENKKTNEVMKTPALNGKFAFNVPAHFDLVMHMESVESQDDCKAVNSRVWRTFNDGQVLCKDASGVLAQFEAPNWGAVFGKILKKESK
jgi:hypothetical protein